MSILQDGSGKGFSAEVDKDLKLQTAAVVSSDEHSHAHDGEAFYMNSADTANSLTATATGGYIMYLKNDDATKVLTVEDIQISADTTAGIVRIIRNPTLGSVADNNATVPVNENFGSAATATVTAHNWDEVNDGIGGLTSGTVLETFIVPVGISVVDVAGRYILNQGDAIGIQYLAKAGEITMGIRFYMDDPT